MAIDGFEKHKVEKTVRKIASGDFDESNIDLLFIGLREYCENNIVFKEIGHFVAHNRARNQGLTNDALEAFYLSLRYFSEYVGPYVPLDFYNPVPAYIKKLLIVQLDKLSDGDIKEKYKESRNTLRSRLDNLFVLDKKSSTVQMKDNVSAPTAKLVRELLSFIQAKQVYTQDLVMEQIFSTLHMNKISFDEGAFSAQSDKIALCILAQLHKTVYEAQDKAVSECSISSERDIIPLGPLVNLEGEKVNSPTFGNLVLNGAVPVLWKGNKNIKATFSIFSTDLLVEEWCEPSMFKIDSVGSAGGPPAYVQWVDFDRQLCLSYNFKLQPL